jgi:hypothetical protein
VVLSSPILSWIVAYDSKFQACAFVYLRLNTPQLAAGSIISENIVIGIHFFFNSLFAFA